MSISSRQIILGTRGSDLARAQTRVVMEALSAKRGLDCAVSIIRTSGDEKAGAPGPAGRKGMFTAEIERALLDERIDVAVHSAKDLPSEMERALELAAVLPRGAVEDLLLTKTTLPLASLREGGTVATGSVRRQRQARWVRPDLKLVDLRGNVPTRLRKFSESDWDAIIVARAGLERLGFSGNDFLFEGSKFFAEILPVDLFVPAGGQGVIALQTRAGEAEIVSAINHRETHLSLRTEREFLRLLQGDCELPVGVHACVNNGAIDLRAQFFGDAIAPRMASARGSDPEKVAAEVFGKIHGH